MLKLEANDVLKMAQAIQVHWPKVDTALPAPLLLQGGYTKATFSVDVATLASAVQALPGQENAQGLALTVRDAQKDVLKEKLKQFRAAVQSELAGTAFVSELGRQPAKLAPEPTFLKAFDDMEDLWSRIQALTAPVFTPPLTLASGYDFPDFQSDLATMRTRFQETREQADQLDQHRRSVHVAANAVWERVKQYRKGCVAKLPTGHDLLANIP